jgi:hypothetical protein
MPEKEYSPGAFIQLVADRFDCSGERALRMGHLVCQDAQERGEPLTKAKAEELAKLR